MTDPIVLALLCAAFNLVDEPICQLIDLTHEFLQRGHGTKRNEIGPPLAPSSTTLSPVV